ncbi:MAG: sigma-70 family RNA polymerase sigma factor [Nannocystaceae bacterium]|nr:sigma-70 family RNA polymerase sigma factor [Nannocystaceae bacterium]
MPPMAALYEQHFERLWWVVRSAGVSDDAIDDVVHDVFVALHHRLARYDGRVPLDRWLVGVARNAAFSHRRSGARRRLRVASLALEPEAAPTPPDERLAMQRAWSQLEGFLAGLPDEQREVFVRIELGGESAPAVADALDVKLNTIYARLRLARGKLEAWLADAAHDADVVVAAARGGGASPQRRTAVWLAIATSTRGPAIATTVATGKLAWLLAPVVAVGLGVGVIAAREDASAPRESTPSRASTAPDARPAAPSSSPAAAPSVLPPSATPTSAAIAAPPQAQAPRPGGARTGARVDAAAVAPAPDDAERVWLEQAHDAIARGDLDAALSLLDRHASRFAGSALAPERAVLRLDALCGAGRATEAREVAKAWRARADLPRIAARIDARLARGCD